MVSTLPCLKATHSSQWGKREGSVNRYVPYKCSLSIDLYWKLLLVWNPSRRCNSKPEKLNDLPSCETEAQLQVVIVFFFCTSRGNSEEWKALVQLLDFFFFLFSFYADIAAAVFRHSGVRFICETGWLPLIGSTLNSNKAMLCRRLPTQKLQLFLSLAVGESVMKAIMFQIYRICFT